MSSNNDDILNAKDLTLEIDEPENDDLEKEEEQHAYFISTAKHRFAAMCVGTFVEKDERKVSCAVNKAGLKGTYDVRIIIDDKKYETGLQLTM